MTTTESESELLTRSSTFVGHSRSVGRSESRMHRSEGEALFVAQVDQQPIANRPRLLADLSRSEPGAGTTLQRLCPTYPNSTEQQISRWLDPRWIDCYMAGSEDNDNYVERRIISYANSEDKTYSKRHWKTHLPEHHEFSSCGTCPKLHSPRTWLVVKSPFSLEHVPAEDCNILGIPGV